MAKLGGGLGGRQGFFFTSSFKKPCTSLAISAVPLCIHETTCASTHFLFIHPFCVSIDLSSRTCSGLCWHDLMWHCYASIQEKQPWTSVTPHLLAPYCCPGAIQYILNITAESCHGLVQGKDSNVLSLQSPVRAHSRHGMDQSHWVKPLPLEKVSAGLWLPKSFTVKWGEKRRDPAGSVAGVRARALPWSSCPATRVLQACRARGINCLPPSLLICSWFTTNGEK